jgi:hypothetical protein
MKHTVYKYGGDQSDEMEFDSHGTLMFERGDIVSRHGATWKIESVEHQDEGNRKLIPTWSVNLTRVLVN